MYRWRAVEIFVLMCWRTVPLRGLLLAAVLLAAAAALFLTSPGATPTAQAQAAGSIDYDSDNDGLIEISNLAQLDAMRWDLDGDGVASNAGPYAQAFPNAMAGMGCPTNKCAGYELVANLDFDTNGNGRADDGDAYWNGGAGWDPIGKDDDKFTATFAGNGHTISNLYVNRPDTGGVGLFGVGGVGSELRQIGLVSVKVTLVSVNVTGDNAAGVGGLVGTNYGTVSGSYATGSVTATSTRSDWDVGGLVGENIGTITDSYATSSVSGVEGVGGLVGAMYGSDASIVRSHATGVVSGSKENVGGLVGYVGPGYQDGKIALPGSGSIQASYATGAVTGSSGAYYVGGLVGRNGGAVTDSRATGRVSGGDQVGGLIGWNSGGVVTGSYARGRVSGENEVGGLVGVDANGSITDSYATGRVTGVAYMGGLAGIMLGNDASISRSHATGVVSGSKHNLGGLVGYVGPGYRDGKISTPGSGSIQASYATGAVTGSSDSDEVGGLVGDNRGIITGGHATGRVSGDDDIGGLVGQNIGSVTGSYATGRVSGDKDVGGLVGEYTNGSITDSYATGRVSGGEEVGGLVGAMYGGDASIIRSHATGVVSGSKENIGGLVGYVGPGYQDGKISTPGSGFIQASYATGAARGGSDSDNVGGLVGRNYGGIVASYATGRVSGGSDVGGLVGRNHNGAITASYWDVQTSGQSASEGGVGKTTRELQSPTSNTGIYATWDLTVWDFGTSSQYPTLKNVGPSVAAPAPQPVALGNPTNLQAAPAGSGEVRLTWTPGANADAHRIDWYKIESDGTETLVDVLQVSGTAASATITGLENGQLYSFVVLASRNVGGQQQFSQESNRAQATPIQRSQPVALGDPTNLQATPAGSGEVRLTWTPGANATVHYVAFMKAGGTWEVWPDGLTGGARGVTITGLTAGQSYWFTVIAGRGPSGSTEWSQWSSAANATAGQGQKPGAPTNLKATPGNAGEVVLSWTPGANATAYEVLWAPDGGQWNWEEPLRLSGNARGTPISGLVPGQKYWFAVRAISNGETSEWAVTNQATMVAQAQSQGGSPQTDRAALVALYNATGGANWDNDKKVNWKSNSPLNNWYGVTTDDNGRVIKLELSDSRLCGEIPAQLGDLSELERLDLSGNRCLKFGGKDPGLTETIPGELGNLTRMTYLDLSDNGLQGQIPKEFRNLERLIHLDLSHNDLGAGADRKRQPKDDNLDWLENLTNLTHLDLSHNRRGGNVGKYADARGLRGEFPLGLAEREELAYTDISHNLFENDLDALLDAFSDRPDGSEFYLNIEGNEWQKSKSSNSMASWAGDLLAEREEITEDDLSYFESWIKSITSGVKNVKSRVKLARNVLKGVRKGETDLKVVYKVAKMVCADTNDTCKDIIAKIGEIKEALGLVRTVHGLAFMYYDATILSNPLVEDLIDSIMLGWLNGWTNDETLDHFVHSIEYFKQKTAEHFLIGYGFWCQVTPPAPNTEKGIWCSVCEPAYDYAVDQGSHAAVESKFNLIRWCEKYYDERNP